MRIDPTQAVGQIAVRHEEAIPVFDRYRIDYSTQGNRSLVDACYCSGADVEKVVQALEGSLGAPSKAEGAAPDWTREPLSKLIGHILVVHHAYTRAQLERMEGLMADLVEGGKGLGLKFKSLRERFQRLAKDMREHMREEEEIYFPYLLEVERARRKGLPVPHPFRGYSALTHPLQILLSDHGMLGKEWREMEELTGGFQAPRDADPGLKELYEAFRELEADNRTHVHLENNILFHKAAQWGLADDVGGGIQKSKDDL